MRASALAFGALFIAAPLAAQGDCFPRSNSREADLFAHFAVPLTFSPAGAPAAYAPGSIIVSLEGVLLPDASDRIATPTTCRPGKGPENVNILPGLVRPRVGFAMGGGGLLEVSWIPPVRVNGVKANIFSFALSRSVLTSASGAMLRGGVHATIGSMRAPITCNGDALDDPLSECFEGSESNDRYSPNIFGVDLSAGWAMSGGRIRPYIGGGYNILHPRFQVDFTNAAGEHDDRKVEVNLSRWVVFGGLTFAPSPRLSFSAEGYSAPTDNVTGRVKLSYAFGGHVPGRRR